MRYVGLLVFLLSIQTFSQAMEHSVEENVCFSDLDNNPDRLIGGQEECDYEGPYNHRTHMDDIVALCSEEIDIFCRCLFR